MTPTFEYCAARFLDHWVSSEAKHHKALQAPSAASVRAALAYFKVSRGFAGIEKPSVGTMIAKLVVAHARRVTPDSAPRRVTKLAEAFCTELGFNNLLSASSKLLWLHKRSPFVIFDSRATRALRQMGWQIDPYSYVAYVRAWRSAYSDHLPNIQRAVCKLPDFVEFTAAASLNRTYVNAVVSESWFAERTFDQYLWIIGRPRKTLAREHHDDHV